MFHLADLAAWNVGTAHRRHARDRADLRPAGGAARRSRSTGHRRAAGADDDPDAGRPSRRSATHDLSSLRRVIYGASPITEAVLDRAMKALPARRFTQAYGMTELSPVATLLPPEDHRDDPRRCARSAGRAAPHAEVRIVDPDDNEVPRGDGRRGRRPRRPRDARLLEQARGDRRGAARRLDAHRRRRLHGRATATSSSSTGSRT